MSEPPRKRAKKLPSYEYTPLRDVVNQQVVNIYGIVKQFKPAKQCRGTDMMTSFFLVDDSLVTTLDKPTIFDMDGVNVNIFASSEDDLPPMSVRVGDVFRGHRLKVNIHNGSAQCYGKLRPHRGGVSVLIAYGDTSGFVAQPPTPVSSIPLLSATTPASSATTGSTTTSTSTSSSSASLAETSSSSLSHTPSPTDPTNLSQTDKDKLLQWTQSHRIYYSSSATATSYTLESNDLQHIDRLTHWAREKDAIAERIAMTHVPAPPSTATSVSRPNPSNRSFRPMESSTASTTSTTTTTTSSSSSTGNRYQKTISQLQLGEGNFDLVSKILYLNAPVQRTSGSMVRLMVWDGTVSTLNVPVPSEDIVPRIGTVVLVTAFDGAAPMISKLNVGDWVMLQKIKTRVQDPLEIVTSPFTAVTKLELGNPLVTRLVAKHAAAISAAGPPAPLSPASAFYAHGGGAIGGGGEVALPSIPRPRPTLITAVLGHESMPISPIGRILAYPSAVAKFRCRANVVAHHPAYVEDFTIPVCPDCGHDLPIESEIGSEDESMDENTQNPENGMVVPSVLNNGAEKSSIPPVCPACLTEVDSPAFSYRFQLRLRDSTGEVNVIVCEEDGLKLFNSLPAVNLYQNNVSCALIRTKIEEVMACDVVDLCIRSYTVPTPNLKSLCSNANRRFRIFDTVIP
eukprot:TRINITY_DN2334_c0_g1_i1.p1 TRINITY_DN2334_c0_g1~~TRINITY_DN2334_c0_g1_i1.p1  ORF type:complete len:708 (-),score=124.58 TRINITY_DN2334_c0_g1_i1:72-2114(-)